MLIENSTGIEVSEESMRNVNCYLYYDYLHISFNGKRVELGCQRVGEGGEATQLNTSGRYLPYS